MIEEPQQYQTDKLIKSSYSVQDQSLDSAIYANRFYNDRMLGEIIAMSKANNELTNKIEEYRRNSPKFLGKWWDSDIGPEGMTVLLNKTQKILSEQIAFMAETMRQFQRQSESLALEREQQTEREKNLSQQKILLQQQYHQLSQSNNQYQQQLQSIIKQRDNFYQTYSQLQYNRGILQLEYNIHTDKVRRIGAVTQNNSFQQAQTIYYQQLKSFLKHALQRKRQVQQLNEQSKRQLNKVNLLLQNLEAQRKGKQLRKESIVAKHLQLNQLREELTVREEKRKQAQRRKDQLQKLYCEQEMQNLALDYQQLQDKCNHILGKALNLAKRSIQTTKLHPVANIINRNSQS